MEALRLEFIENMSKHDVDVNKLNSNIIDDTFKPPCLEEIHIPPWAI